MADSSTPTREGTADRTIAFRAAIIGSICSDQAEAESLCRGKQFAVKRGKGKVVPLGKLKVGSVIHRELEAIGHVQRSPPGMDIGVAVCGDIKEQKISKSGAAEVRIYSAATHGNSQTVGDLQPPERRHNCAIIGHGVKEA